MKTLLIHMLSTLQEYRRDKTVLMQQYIVDRLDKSFSQYDKELQQSIQFLTKKHEKSLLKRMNKLK